MPKPRVIKLHLNSSKSLCSGMCVCSESPLVRDKPLGSWVALGLKRSLGAEMFDSPTAESWVQEINAVQRAPDFREALVFRLVPGLKEFLGSRGLLKVREVLSFRFVFGLKVCLRPATRDTILKK